METYNTSAGPSGFMYFIIFLFAAVQIVAMWRIFTKAGKPGWAAIVPVYNFIVLLEIVGKPLWWIVLFLIPCVNIVFYIWTVNLLSKSFGQSEGFTIGLILLSVVFYPMLAFGNYNYLGPAGAGPLGNYDPSKDYRNPFSDNNPPTQL